MGFLAVQSEGCQHAQALELHPVAVRELAPVHAVQSECRVAEVQNPQASHGQLKAVGLLCGWSGEREERYRIDWLALLLGQFGRRF